MFPIWRLFLLLQVRVIFDIYCCSGEGLLVLESYLYFFLMLNNIMVYSRAGFLTR